MRLEGFHESPRQTPGTPEDALAADVHKTLMGLQKMRALRDAGLDHLSPESATSQERNEAMTQYIVKGKAAAFAEEFGSNPDPEKIKQALRDLGIPTKDDTLH